MKIRYILIALFALLNIAFSFGQKEKTTEKYYYYKGEKKIIKVNQNRLTVYLDNAMESDFGQIFDVNNTKISRIIKRKNSISKSNANSSIICVELILNDSKKYDETIRSLKNNVKVKAIESVIGDTLPVMTSNLFYVKVKAESDTIVLKQMAQKTQSRVVRAVSHSKNWYALEVDKQSVSNSLDVSNLFAESLQFDKVDPGFILEVKPNCVSDARFNEQWSINNTGVDINACAAWGITTGDSNVIVAVIDQGVDNSHPEFTGINFTTSYDAETRTSPADLYGDHGTHVCGIISANHNSYNTAGVAPGVSIMEVSHSLSVIPTISEDLATGINWAVQNGADVLSNSWGDQGGYLYNDLHSTLLEDAIDNALDYGRGGLGSIVVFAAGNWAPDMDYPGYYRPEILTVGSIDSTGTRSYFSGYGSLLDVVAPGEEILSTIPNNQYDFYSGTSMATPHVSALAGLILSRDASLTRSEVANIIESTTQKIGGYNYQTTSGRPNGTWNEEMGYGLIDAYAAVAAVCATVNFINQTVTSNTSVNGCKVNVQDVTVQNGAKLSIDAERETIINSNFEVQSGSSLEIQ